MNSKTQLYLFTLNINNHFLSNTKQFHNIWINHGPTNSTYPFIMNLHSTNYLEMLKWDTLTNSHFSPNLTKKKPFRDLCLPSPITTSRFPTHCAVIRSLALPLTSASIPSSSSGTQPRGTKIRTINELNVQTPERQNPTLSLAWTLCRYTPCYGQRSSPRLVISRVTMQRRVQTALVTNNLLLSSFIRWIHHAPEKNIPGIAVVEPSWQHQFHPVGMQRTSPPPHFSGWEPLTQILTTRLACARWYERSAPFGLTAKQSTDTVNYCPLAEQSPQSRTTNKQTKFRSRCCSASNTAPISDPHRIPPTSTRQCTPWCTSS